MVAAALGVMKSSEICIIHLSDLHFSAEKYKSVYGALLDDIEKQICNEEYIVLIVTGDFATKGCVSECKEEVVDFFKNLSARIPETAKLLDVELVPGNHDVCRPNIGNDFNQGTYLPCGSEFETLKDSIYSVFEKWGVSAHGITGPSYIHHNGKTIAFVRLDTSCFLSRAEIDAETQRDFQDHGEGLGGSGHSDLSVEQVEAKRVSAFDSMVKRQLVDVNRQFKELMAGENGKAPYLTFALSHHPLTVLNTTGFDNLAEILYKRGLYFVDAMICGHQHKAQLYYTLDNSRQKVLLMTGVGWQESENTPMRYSIYRLSLERNTCQVKVRHTTEGAPFSSDDSVGDDGIGEFSKANQYTLPLKTNKVGGVIYLASRQPSLAKGLFVDQGTLSLLPVVSKALVEYGVSIREKVNGYAAVVYAMLSRKGIALEGLDPFLNNVDFDGSQRLKEQVQKIVKKEGCVHDFLRILCCQLIRSLAKIKGDLDAEDASGHLYTVKPEWRVHYRCYQGVTKGLFKKRRDLYLAKEAMTDVSSKCNKPSIMKWGGLIKGAFEHESHMLVNSAVPGLNEHRTTEWSDFMTMCPCFPGSVVSVEAEQGSVSQERPLITFGISFKALDFETLQHASRILYMLEYLNVNAIIENALSALVKRFCIGPNEFKEFIR